MLIWESQAAADREEKAFYQSEMDALRMIATFRYLFFYGFNKIWMKTRATSYSRPVCPGDLLALPCAWWTCP